MTSHDASPLGHRDANDDDGLHSFTMACYGPVVGLIFLRIL
jgi:hypothetical protein